MKEKMYFFAFLILLVCFDQGGAQQCTQTQLNTEFTTDPTARTYATCVDDVCVLDKFNAVCTDATCKVDNVLSREVILETIINSGELETLANSTAPADLARHRQLGWLLQATYYNMNKGSNQSKWKNVFPAGSSPNTNAAINAAQQKNAPRSQIVCGRAGTIDDISCGLRGTGCH